MRETWIGRSEGLAAGEIARRAEVPPATLSFHLKELKNAGLVVAEVELSSSEEEVALPPWIEVEVSDDHRYANAYLSAHPYSEWGGERR